ncbi:MAG TPA: glycoside hydrolase family 2 TIM barrel-domain containing protein [Verrucomicrobiae bacterium]|nr:glycoside hydrolase family 2 TIM barrel-domain containing protein [Verrucomicrobiae bacterium]
MNSLHLLRRLSTLCLFLACLAPGTFAGPVIPLNGSWQFRIDPSDQGTNAGWFREMPADTETVSVPHTWNIGEHHDYEGNAWYFRQFDVDADSMGKRAELNFGATFYKSRIWLNGVEVGSHEGGHTAYVIDITKHLQRRNFLAVQLNNEPGFATIPGLAMRLSWGNDTDLIWYDWWHYGGIVRDAWIEFRGPALIRRQQIRSSAGTNEARVETRVFLENHGQKPVRATLMLRAFAPTGGKPVATAEQTIQLSPGGQDIPVNLRLPSPQLWHFDHPRLYRMEAELVDDGGGVLDSRSDSFGVRTIEIRDRHLFVNGERVRLSGVSRHEDSPWEGLAETRGTIRADYDDLKNLQTTLSRPVHYPQPPEVLDYCDRNGILLIPEIPLWQFSEKQLSDPRVLALAKQMMREMIEQAYNHPCIMAWSMCNEGATHLPGGVAYFKTMRDLVKSIDPDRFVSYADDTIARTDQVIEAAQAADFIMLNQYYGNWHGPAHLLESALENAGKRYPDKMFIVSEFGFLGLFGPDPATSDRLRVETMRDQMSTFAKFDWIAGAIFWCYQDFPSHRNVWPGQMEGIMDMGVVDENRQRRPSYDFWKELNCPVRVHLIWNCSTSYPYPPMGFDAGISRRDISELPSHSIGGYRVTWEAHNHFGDVLGKGEEMVNDPASAQIRGKWDWKNARSIELTLRVYRPTGFVVYEKQMSWRNPIGGGQAVKDMKVRSQVPKP